MGWPASPACSPRGGLDRDRRAYRELLGRLHLRVLHLVRDSRALENLALHLLLRSPSRYQVIRYDPLTTRPPVALGDALERIGAADLGFLQDARLRPGSNRTVGGATPRSFRTRNGRTGSRPAPAGW